MNWFRSLWILRFASKLSYSTLLILCFIHTGIMTTKHGDTGEVSIATVGGLGSHSEAIQSVGRQTTDLRHRIRPDLNALPVGDIRDVRRRRRVVVDAVADDALVQRRVPGHFSGRRRDSSKLNVRRRRQNICTRARWHWSVTARKKIIGLLRTT